MINHLDEQQREQIEQSETHQPLKSISYTLEESQDIFNCCSTLRTDSETFMCVFNEARNNNESFFTASQRLNDFSKTLRTKQSYCIGKINPEVITPQIRGIEKLYNINLAELPLRTWLYEGKTFVSPTWTQNKKPFIINAEIRKDYFKSTNSQPTKYKLIPASEY